MSGYIYDNRYRDMTELCSSERSSSLNIAYGKNESIEH